MSEKECLDGLVDGNREAFTVLYKKYSRLLYCFSLKFLKDEQAATDLVQDVFLKVWEKRKSVRNTETFSAYLMTIGHHQILNGFRKNLTEQKYSRYIKEQHTITDKTTENQIVFRDLFKATQEVINQLPEKRKEIFRLSRDQGLSNQEIAIAQNISIRTVENHIYKALAYLKDKLVDEDLDNSRTLKRPKNSH